MQVELGNEPNSEPYVILDPSQGCVERMISTGELAARFRLPYYRIRKWADQGRIPVCHPVGDHRMFPEERAMEAVRRILADGFENAQGRQQ